jgi:hypothetical protein
MKKLIFLTIFGCLLLGSNAFALQIQKSDEIQCSTITPTITPNIDSASVRIKQICITNAGTAQTITIYKNAKTGYTPAIVNVFDVQASVPFYYPSTLANDEQNFDIPYFAIMTSTSTNAAHANVIYKD